MTGKRALLARPNDLAASWMKAVFEEAGLSVVEAVDDADLAVRLAETWLAVAVSTSVSSPVRAPWRQVLADAAASCPAALLVLVTIDWSPDIARQLRPEFSPMPSSQVPETGFRGVLLLTLKQLRDRAERRDLGKVVSRWIPAGGGQGGAR